MLRELKTREEYAVLKLVATLNKRDDTITIVPAVTAATVEENEDREEEEALVEVEPVIEKKKQSYFSRLISSVKKAVGLQ